MTSYVKREKYEYVKEKGCMWRDKAIDYKRRYDTILEENNKLIKENDELQDKLISGNSQSRSSGIYLSELEKCVQKIRQIKEKKSELETEEEIILSEFYKNTTENGI